VSTRGRRTRRQSVDRPTLRLPGATEGSELSATPDPTFGAPRISVVVPVFNEAEVLPELLARIVSVLEHDWSFEIVIVDDGSTDETWPVVRAAQRQEPRIRGVSLARNFGKEPAIFAGIREAVGDAIIVMDGDLQHPPSLLPEMIARWQAGAQVVEAVKTSRPGQPVRVRVGARLFNRAFSRLTGVDLVDATDLRLLSRPAADALMQLPERSVFFRGTSSWIGFRREQVAFEVGERASGETHFTIYSLARFAIRSLTAFTSAPLHLVTMVGIVFAVLSFILGAHTLYSWLRGTSVEGFTTVILLLLILGSAILVGLGIIGEYLARIHEEVKARPRYIIADRTAAPASDA
jgi:polyisoprenyl-phosphate glycosyltransferase